MKRASFLLADLAAIAFLISGPGTRFGWYPFEIGLLLFALALPLALIALILSVITIARGRALTPLLTLAVGISLVLIIVTGWHIAMAFRAPPIHDITTDPSDPPQFSAVVPLRGPHTNPVAYGGAAVADQQRRAYPDIAPLILHVPPAKAFALATQAANALDIDIVDSRPDSGRIEGTAQTSWFGFKDDVVILIRPSDGGSRIDVRSLSRVGRGDAGENARRVRALLRWMQRG